MQRIGCTPDHLSDEESPVRSADHPFEKDRIAFLNRLDLLDTDPEQIFDDFVLLAAAICNVPIAVVSLVDEERQWFKAKVGLEVDETSREVSFCSHAILQSGPMVVEDATLDPRFVDNALVVGDFHLRFYAGIPVTVEGYPLGTLCAIDRKPVVLNEIQLNALEVLGRQLSDVLESRLMSMQHRAAILESEYKGQTLMAANRRFEDLFQKMAVASYTCDLEGMIVEFNAEAERMFGYSSSQMFGRYVDDLIPSEDSETCRQIYCEVERGNSVSNVERRIVRADGEKIWTLSNVHPVKGPSGEITGAMSIHLDIAQRKALEAKVFEANAQLEVLARTDGLTKVANRRGIIEFLEKRVSGGHSVSVVMLDVDFFKSFNDRFGHQAGDDILIQFGQLLQSECRPDDRVGRYGGEEFLVVLPGTTPQSAYEAAERIRSAIEAATWPFAAVTASLGVASVVEQCATAEKLISLADARLYAAKGAGRNRVIGQNDHSVPHLRVA